MSVSAGKTIIVNADDFGLSEGVSRAIVRGHDAGIITSTSMMVRPASAAMAAELARAHPRLGVGLHIDLGEWAVRDGEWTQLYAVVDLEDERAIAAEIERQLDEFRRLTGSEPTHLDSHQHVHRSAPVASVVRAIAQRLDVPLRHSREGPRYHGDFYGQDVDGSSHPEWVSSAALAALIARIPAGVNEIACHPGEPDDPAIATTMYRSERALELDALCDPIVREAIERSGARLASFRDMGFAVVA